MRLIILFIFLVTFSYVTSDSPRLKMRHEYRLTFKAPYILPPGINDIPFFNHGGMVIPGTTAVRLTTSLPNQQGWIWTKNASDFPGFQIDIKFKISGRGKFGADGLALWIVEEKSHGGPALGASSIWKGLGVFFDTYDNNGHGDSPIVIAALNDGTKHYEGSTDGRNIALNQGHCVKDFRNRPYPVHSRIRYLNGHLDVFMSSGLTFNQDLENNEQKPLDLELCFTIPLNLPRKPYYFGMSSATGSLGDDHDVMHFEVHSYVNQKDLDTETEKKRVEEEKKYEEEYKKQLSDIKDTEENKSDNKQAKGGSAERRDESELNQNLIIIWKEMANQNTGMKNVLKTLNDLHNNQFGQLADKFENIRKELAKLKPDGSATDSFQNQKGFVDLHNAIDILKTDIAAVNNKLIGLEKVQRTPEVLQSSDTQCSSCVSFSVLLIISFLQSLFIIVFMIYQKQRDSAAKKFY